MPNKNKQDVPRSSRPFVFQDNASDRSSDYQGGSEASSARRILTSINQSAYEYSHAPPPTQVVTDNGTSSRQPQPSFTPIRNTSSPGNIIRHTRVPHAPPTRTISSEDDSSSFLSHHSFLPRRQSGSNSCAHSVSVSSPFNSSSNRPSHHRSNSFPLPPNSKRFHHLSPASTVSSMTSLNSASAFTGTSSDSYFADSSSFATSPSVSTNTKNSRLTTPPKIPAAKPASKNHVINCKRQDGGEASDTEISHLTSDSAESPKATSQGNTGLVARFLSGRPPTPNSGKRPLSHSVDQNVTIADTSSSSWALSTGIGSIPEELDSEAKTTTDKKPKQQPKHSSPTKSIISTLCSVSSPQSQPSLANSSFHHMDSSSHANASIASGFQSEGTGFQSETTVVVRNTSGFPRKIVAGDASDIETGGSSVHPLPLWSLPLPPLSLIPSGRELDDSSPAFHHDKDDTSTRRKQRKKSKFCRGTQGLVIGLLVALFVFGVITVVVSFVLSQRNSQNSTESAAVDASNDDFVGLFNGSTIINDDDNLSSPLDFGATNGTTSPSIQDTFFESPIGSTATKIPSAAPSTQLSEEDVLFADVVEELLLDSEPTGNPSVIVAPSSTPSLMATTIFPNTNVPTSKTPTVTPQAISVSSTITAAPTPLPTNNPNTLKPTAAPTTANPTPNPSLAPSTAKPTLSPTEQLPLLHPDTILREEAQLWGEAQGDTAGSAVALSGNGQILLVGAPNSTIISNSEETHERSGRVQVYERRWKAAATASLPRSGVDWEWTLRATILGEEVPMGQLGFSLATNDDGSIIVISQPTADRRRGMVTLYEWLPQTGDVGERSGEYVALQVLMGDQTTDLFGSSVSLSGDGRRLAVGSPYYSSDAKPGESDSNLRGQVHIFEYSEGIQEYEPMDANGESFLLGSSSLDWFGWAVSLSNDGEMLAVGAPRNTEFGGYVQCFRYNGDEWTTMGAPIINTLPPVKLDDRFGHAVSLTTTGTTSTSTADNAVTRVAVGSPWKDVGNVLNSGMVAIYEWSETQSRWMLDSGGALGGILTEDKPGFYHQLGYSVQMDGDAVSVGVPGWENRRGLVDIFYLSHAFPESGDATETTTSSWKSLNTPLVGEGAGDDFGFSVTMSVQLNGGPQVETSEKSSIILAVGAIMVSASIPESTGYSKVFHTSDTL